ncbi:hypothetical protein [uncultured Nisaea sp.]|uniref:hypothetical protein n=1 Tax=uncultured Nisaea sp. TaxID=538215 RepID=UPI0030EB2136|tara:strand:- start:4783 stop:6045 length:1263 start_codon:yes stop_codon:yes gene_type:complete
MSRRRGNLPPSFEARGASVPFNSKSLKECRLRVVDLGHCLEWEATLPSGMGGIESRSVMILPWHNLPNFTSMSPRDRALFDRLDASDDDDRPDPFKIRELRIRVDQTLAETEEARQLAAAEVEKEKQDRLMTYMSFLAQLTRDCGIRQGDTFMAGADTALLMRLTNDRKASAELGLDPAALTERVLNFAAEEVGAPRKLVNQQLEELTGYMSPFGAVNVETSRKKDGFLTRSRNEIKAMDRSLAKYARNSREEVSNRITLIRFAIKDFLDYVDERFSSIEQFFSFFINVFREFSKSKAFAQQVRRDVSYALDGWSHLCMVWNAAHETGEAAKVDEAIEYILKHLPLMPEEEVRADEARNAIRRGFETARAQMVRTMVNWVDNQVDRELEQRVAIARKTELEQTPDEDQPKRRRRQASVEW